MIDLAGLWKIYCRHCKKHFHSMNSGGLHECMCPFCDHIGQTRFLDAYDDVKHKQIKVRILW